MSSEVRECEYTALLDAFLDGELPEDQAACLREHLDSCPACRSYLDDMMAIRAAFPTVEDTQVPEGFADRVLDRLPARVALMKPGQQSWREGLRRTWRRAALPVAASLALILALRGVWLTGGTNAGDVMSRTLPVEADAVEDAAQAPAMETTQGTEQPESSTVDGTELEDTEGLSGEDTAAAMDSGVPAAGTDAGTPDAASDRPVGTETETASGADSGTTSGTTSGAVPGTAETETDSGTDNASGGNGNTGNPEANRRGTGTAAGGANGGSTGNSAAGGTNSGSTRNSAAGGTNGGSTRNSTAGGTNGGSMNTGGSTGSTHSGSTNNSGNAGSGSGAAAGENTTGQDSSAPQTPEQAALTTSEQKASPAQETSAPEQTAPAVETGDIPVEQTEPHAPSVPSADNPEDPRDGWIPREWESGGSSPVSGYENLDGEVSLMGVEDPENGAEDREGLPEEESDETARAGHIGEAAEADLTLPSMAAPCLGRFLPTERTPDGVWYTLTASELSQLAERLDSAGLSEEAELAKKAAENAAFGDSFLVFLES